jgi:cell division protein FtsW
VRFDFRYSFLIFSLLVGAIGGLIVLQPDLSTAAIIVLTAWTMLFLAGGDLLQLLLNAGGAVAVGWLLIMQFDYARERLVAHLSAVSDLTLASWHVQQAIIAFTAPGHNPADPSAPNWFGRGLGQSSQKFGFLPAPHTDSIFAIIGEELGVVGCLVVIALFALFAWRAFTIASEAGDPYGALLAAGIGCWISYEALLNVAVLTAVIPFTGVPLPFISFGGSSLVTALAGVGLLMSVSRKRRQEPRRTSADYGLGRRDGRGRVSRVSYHDRPEP